MGFINPTCENLDEHPGLALRLRRKFFEICSRIGNSNLPGFNPLGEGRHNSVESIVSDMKVGAVIILANFNIIDSSATVRAAGKVKDIRNDSIYVEWKKIIPSLSLHPHKIGAKQWEKESVFLINPQRVRDFKLDRLIKKCFPVSL